MKPEARNGRIATKQWKNAWPFITFFPHKMASSVLKGTRKTYSFEEREILITLINKYEDVDDKKSDPISMCKRKSAWSQLAEEYNAMVGPQGARSAVQLRRCWENMKACKKNREEKKSRANHKSIYHSGKDGRSNGQRWESGSCGMTASEAATTTGTVGLPPNIVFEPKESEPFTLQSVCTAKPAKINLKKELNTDGGAFKHTLGNPDSLDSKAMGDCPERAANELDSSIADRTDEEDSPEKDSIVRSHGTQTFSPFAAHDHPSRKLRKCVHREAELHALALSEAQMKVDIAAMLKQEARIKLEEAHYRKEEARLRMLLFTYKLDRVKED